MVVVVVVAGVADGEAEEASRLSMKHTAFAGWWMGNSIDVES